MISTLRRLGEKDHEFEASLGCIVRHNLKIKLTGKQRMKEQKKAREGKGWGGERGKGRGC